MNLLAYNLGTTVKVMDSAPAAAHSATIADVESWADRHGYYVIPKPAWQPADTSVKKEEP